MFVRTSLRSRAIRLGGPGGGRGDGDAESRRSSGRAGRAGRGPRPRRRRRCDGSSCPPGFKATLFAAEPDVVQPIAMTIDPRGRLWVVENFSYPDLAGRPARQGPHPDLRGRRRRRPVRPPHGLLRQGDQLHRHRAGLRRRLGLRHAQPAVHPRPRRRRPARRPAGRQARRLEHQRPAQPLQRPEVGPRRLALGLQRHPLDCARRQARHAGRGPRADQLRRLALSPDPRGLRGRRARHDQPLGPRLRRLRRGVHHQLRDPPPVPRDPRRALSADVRQGLQPAPLRPDDELRRPPPLGRRALAGLARGQAASTARPAAATPTSAR